MSTISIVRDWGAISGNTRSIRAVSGIVSSVKSGANEFLIDKPRRGVLYRALTVSLAAGRGAHIYQDKSSLGPTPKITTSGWITTTTVGLAWKIFHRRGSSYTEGMSQSELILTYAIECWASRFYAVDMGTTDIDIYDYKQGNWILESIFTAPTEIGALARIGRNLLMSQLDGTSIMVYHAHGSTLYAGDTLTAPFNVRRMAFDGRYLWLTSATNLYQCSLRA